MILAGAEPVSRRWPPAGAEFRATVGRPDGLRPETSGIWRFLHAAREWPLSLDLVAEPGDTADWVGDLPALEPLARGCRESAITIYTSGTTGAPKPCRHALAPLFQRTRWGAGDATWLLAYAPFRWAGLSVVLHVMCSGARLVVPETLAPWALVDAAIRHKITHVSMTPSHFRRLLLSFDVETLRGVPLRQMTFGGEAATQAVLDLARSVWPHARVSHVYATSESGDICSVSDGLEGVPRARFERPSMALSAEGELNINGRPTGDLWELHADRYFFIGRREEVINVGGIKVFPFKIEAAALNIPGVRQARASGRGSPLLGQVVVLEYSGSIEEAVLRRALRDRLPKVAWPAAIEHRDDIPMTPAGKTMRVTSP